MAMDTKTATSNPAAAPTPTVVPEIPALPVRVRTIYFIDPVEYKHVAYKTPVYPEKYLRLEMEAQHKIKSNKKNMCFGWFAAKTKAAMSLAEITYCAAHQQEIIVGLAHEYMEDSTTCNVLANMQTRASVEKTLFTASNDFDLFVQSAISRVKELSHNEPVQVKVVYLPEQGLNAIPEDSQDKSQVIVWLAGSIAKLPNSNRLDWRNDFIEAFMKAQQQLVD